MVAYYNRMTANKRAALVNLVFCKSAASGPASVSENVRQNLMKQIQKDYERPFLLRA